MLNFLKNKITIISLTSFIVLLGFNFFLKPFESLEIKNFTQEVSQGGEITLQFSKPIKKETFKKNLIISPQTKYKLIWENLNTVKIITEKKFKNGEEVKISFKKNPKDILGNPLQGKKEYIFKFVEKPKINFYSPQKKALLTDPIIINFSRPISSLSTLSQENFSKIKIKPSIKGNFEYLGTSTLKFTPEKNYLPATKYEVIISKNFKDISGVKLDKDFSFEFETEKAYLKKAYLKLKDNEINLNNSADLYKKQKIYLEFNQEIKIDSVKKQLFLSKEKIKKHPNYDIKEYKKKLKPKEKIKNLEETLKQEKINFKLKFKTENKKVVVLTPLNNWQKDYLYHLIVKPKIKSNKGNLVEEDLEKTVQYDFYGVPDFEIISVSPDKKIEKNFNTEIKIAFSNKINPDDLLKNLKITPPLKNYNKEKKIYLKQNRIFKDWIKFEPSTTYKISISNQLKDFYGRTLNKDYTWSFKTGQKPADFNLITKGKDFGVFESGLAPDYKITYVNLKNLKIKLAKLNLSDVLEIQNNKKKDWQYNPNINKYKIIKNWQLNLKNNKINETLTENLNLNKYLDNFQSGVFMLELSSSEVISSRNKKPKKIYHIFSFTPYALTLKYNQEEAYIFASDLKNAKPVKDLKISFLNLAGQEFYYGKTNEKGFLKTNIDLKNFQIKDKPWLYNFFVKGNKNNKTVFVGNDWEDGVQAWKFNLSKNHFSPENKAKKLLGKIYTDRPIYKPGETVYFKGFIRKLTQDKIKIPQNENINLVIHNSDWDEIFNKTYSVSSFGSFNDKFVLPKDLKYGNFYIVANNKNYNNEINGNFWVSHFQKSPFKIEIKTNKEEYVWGDKVKGKITAETFFETPLKDEEVFLDINSTDYYFNKVKDDWYSFSKTGNWCYGNCNRENHHILSEKIKLSSKGEANFDFIIKNKKDESDPVELSQVYSINARINDKKTDQELSKKKEILAHYTDFYLGIKTEDHLIRAGDKVKFKTISLEKNGEKKANTNFKAELFKRDYKTIKKKSIDDEFYYENETKDTLIKTKDLKTDKNGLNSNSFEIKKGGNFFIRVSSNDEKNNKIVAETEFWVSSNENISWPKSNNDRIEVIKDKQEYKIGDTAKLLVKSPYKKAKALITVEQNHLLDFYQIDLNSNLETIKLKIKENYLPNVFVSIILQKPRSSYEKYDKSGKDIGQPEFKIAYLKIPVETSSKKLNIKISTNKKEYLPQEEVKLDLEIKDSNNKPSQSEISISVVDLSLLALTGYQKPNLLKDFYAERYLGINSSYTFSKFIERFKPGAKGGGGGENSKTRGEFKNTAYFIADLKTDEKGLLSTKFKLPDNLTTWKITVTAQDKKNNFGSKSAEIIEKKPVIISPALPQFFLPEDIIKIKTVVSNQSKKTDNFQVFLKTKEADIISPKPILQKIEKDGRKEFIFEIKIKNKKEANFNFIVKNQNGKILDNLVLTRPIKPLKTKEVVKSSGSFTENQQEKLFLPKDIYSNLGKLEVSFSPSKSYLLPKSLELLSSYPYDCNEQIISKIFPNSLILNTKIFKDLFDSEKTKKIKTQINNDLIKIYERQLGDGSWGYFNNNQKENKYLTAYILIALEEMKLAGEKIDKNVLNKAQEYLFKNRISDDKNEESFIRWALSYSHSLNDEYIKRILKTEKNIPYFTYIYWSLASKNKEFLTPVINSLKQTDNTAFVEEKKSYQKYWASNKRTTALLFYALEKLDKNNYLIPKLLSWLNQQRNHQGYGNTQENVWSILGIINNIKKHNIDKTDYLVNLTISGKELFTKKFSNKNLKENFGIFDIYNYQKDLSSLPKDQEISLNMNKKGEGTNFYDLELSYFLPAKNIKAQEKGFSLIKEYYDLKGNKLKEIPNLGETFKIKLKIIVPYEANFVALESFVPAGIIPINTNFKNTDQTLKENLNQNTNWKNQATNYFNYIEFNEDKVFLFAEYLPQGFYEYEYAARVSHQGSFSYLPNRIFEMYSEDRFARTKGEKILIE